MGEVSSALEELDLSDMVLALANSIMSSQHAMDLMSLRVAQRMADTKVDFDSEPTSLLELGFAPTFYQFAETSFELKVSISVSRDTSQENTSSQTTTESETSTRRTGFLGLGGSVTKTTTKVTAVSARYATRFQYSAQGSSQLTTRIVASPAPALLMDVVHQMIKDAGT